MGDAQVPVLLFRSRSLLRPVACVMLPHARLSAVLLLWCAPSRSDPRCATQRLRVVQEARTAFEHNALVYTEQVALGFPLCHLVYMSNSDALQSWRGVYGEMGKFPPEKISSRASLGEVGRERAWAVVKRAFANGGSPCIVLTVLLPQCSRH